MRKGISLILIATAFWAGCTKEQIPSGLNLHSDGDIFDTTYTITSIPSAQTKNIFMEDATGVKCPNCPAGAAAIANLKSTYPQIISAAIYSPFLNEFQAPAKYDFNSTDADDLVKFLGGDPNKPACTIDRLPTNYSSGAPYFFKPTDWSAIVASIAAKTTPLNIDLSATPNGSKYDIKSKITFTNDITGDLAISLYLIEDSVVDLQELPFGAIDTNYVHNHILRKIITPISGSGFLSSIPTKQKGNVFERTFYSIALPSNVINKAHCRLICFVHKTGASKEIIHVEEIDL